MQLRNIISLTVIATFVLSVGFIPSASAYPELKLPKIVKKTLRLRDGKDGEGDVDEDDLKTKVETPFVGQYATITGLKLVNLQGVGLVTGLDATGSDPRPSHYRTQLLEEMYRRNVRNPKQILRSPNTALVIVKAYLPPLISKGDDFDVEVYLPADSEATSLNGGWLLDTHLMEKAIVPGHGIKDGFTLARAKGPILISAREGSNEELAGVVRRGRVLGGGRSLEQRDMTIYLHNDFRSVRNSKRIAYAIGKRFYDYDEHGLKHALAKAMTDQKIELQILDRYKDNYPRFQQVVRHIAFRESDVAQRVRLERLQESLLNPLRADRSAIMLEAIGSKGKPALVKGLKSPHLEVRFHAAMALAYLGDSTGLPHLAEAAREEPAFRAYAYAAMAASGAAKGNLLLRDLMNEQSAETRYGAFRALSTMDPGDPFLNGKKLNDEFMFHALSTTGHPMVHITNRRKAEVVLFGANQKLVPPLLVRAGKRIMVTCREGSKTVTVTRYAVGEPEQRKQVSLRLADVILAVAEFGASFPDTAQMLTQAGRQKNLEGTIEVDAVPAAGRVYIRPSAAGKGDGSKSAGGSKTKVGNPMLAPNLFSNEGKPEKPAEKTDVDVTSKTDAASSTFSDASDVNTTVADEKRSSLGKAWRRLLRGSGN